VREVWHPKVDLGVPGSQVVDLGEFLLCPGEADLQSLDLTLTFLPKNANRRNG
jgi:hypothetical protein